MYGICCKCTQTHIRAGLRARVPCASRDCTRYAARVSAQEPLQEAITGMAAAVFDLLGLWWRCNGRQLPTVIIMFRDGVSEGQFAAVMQQELEAIREVGGWRGR